MWFVQKKTNKNQNRYDTSSFTVEKKDFLPKFTYNNIDVRSALRYVRYYRVFIRFPNCLYTHDNPRVFFLPLFATRTPGRLLFPRHRDMQHSVTCFFTPDVCFSTTFSISSRDFFTNHFSRTTRARYCTKVKIFLIRRPAKHPAGRTLV